MKQITCLSLMLFIFGWAYAQQTTQPAKPNNTKPGVPSHQVNKAPRMPVKAKPISSFKRINTRPIAQPALPKGKTVETKQVK